MSIAVKFFARLREELGKSEASVESSEPLTIQQIWAETTEGAELAENILCALNMEYVSSDTLAKDGDEVAFFPPVTGG
ncbi:MAG: MoaD/ThiS family protein [Pseudomonadota bacterium]